jgi:nicotinamidase-related amidase
MTEQKPKLPQPESVTIAVDNCAVLVLDGSQRWSNPDLPCHKLVPGIKKFLDRAREVGVPIIYSVSFRNKGKPEGEVCSELMRRQSEPVIYPDGFDKFAGGELQGFLNLYNVDTLIITGYRSNICVLHTGIKATRELNYNVVIPIDGMTAHTDYEQEYTLVHFTVVPAQAAERFTFTMLDMISFK